MSAKVSNDFSTLIKKDSCRSSSCASACLGCVSANEHSVLSSRRFADQTNDRAAFLRLAETLTAFLARLRSASETLSVTERQRIVRLLVKDVLVGEDTITIRHSIPIPPPQNGGSQSPDGQNYLLCTGRDQSVDGEHLSTRFGYVLDRTVFATRNSLPIRRRLRDRLPKQQGGRASSGDGSVDHGEPEIDSAPHQDSSGGLGQERLRVSGIPLS
jgi:hypothetical protein